MEAGHYFGGVTIVLASVLQRPPLQVQDLAKRDCAAGGHGNFGRRAALGKSRAFPIRRNGWRTASRRAPARAFVLVRREEFVVPTGGR